MIGRQIAKDCAEYQYSKAMVKFYKWQAKQGRLLINLTSKDKKFWKRRRKKGND